jgi:2Fe-2S ferredoxin
MASDKSNGEQVKPKIAVRFVLEAPEALTGSDQADVELAGEPGDSLLDVALFGGINIEHACGGVCACSTCHIYVEEGMDQLSEAEEDEEDRVEEAPGLQRNSRLACQCIIEGDGPVVVRVPAWNRNAVKEVPH